jgi:hypothetical protein
VQPPVLVCLSPRGLIISRDQGEVAADLVTKRIDDAVSRFEELDARYRLLQAAAARDETNAAAQLAVAEFLLGQQNDREAISPLAVVAGDAAASTGVRVRAWVELARAHLWISEPEKGRHEAKNLIAALGPAAPEAIAGGNLVLGTQDATAKRFTLARQEFESAISASPDSDYATEARNALAKLPKENN